MVRTSVSTLCRSSENSPYENTILYHLRTKFEPERLERVSNALLRRYVVEQLPEQAEVCAELPLRPYSGEEDETNRLDYSEPKRGTAAFHAYATLYARVKNKRYTLMVNRLEDADTASSVLAEFLGVLGGLDTDVKAVYLDLASTIASVSRCPRHTTTCKSSRSSGGETIQQELSNRVESGHPA